mmetsp:Transcript_4322/g.9616  ORF Transcript_4322/g.9616 Transcript_4322/m.9616 type:complete len:98 (-) Transcript_4322:274-567(-)|eukprot:CAMPEP_0171341186 /NCGR_PEP_ID=MMETSP0878-20121228/9534_1 /TAXON_ID=67004 /ORGANISM="Thalassiosira weissflogii, Strain CCMP1336" /LENGTH=97 /DNA_ID=CAMNT_0011843351 /DNA_START=174 /DNA_END=467 /DNA_ORIENTATION=-
MGYHLPSALVGSVVAGSGFLLIHRELSHRRRLTTKWELQEYAENQWKEWRSRAFNTPVHDASKKNIFPASDPTADVFSTWNKGVAALRGMLKTDKNE